MYCCSVDKEYQHNKSFLLKREYSQELLSPTSVAKIWQKPLWQRLQKELRGRQTFVSTNFFRHLNLLCETFFFFFFFKKPLRLQTESLKENEVPLGLKKGLLNLVSYLFWWPKNDLVDVAAELRPSYYYGQFTARWGLGSLGSSLC